MGMNQVALVTGGNRGIGLEICRQLAARGLQVVLTCRDPEKGQAAKDVLQKEGHSVEFHPLDVTNEESIRAIAAFIRTSFRRLDVLVNNAGVLLDPPRHPPDAEGASILNASIDTIRRSMESNTYGAIRLSQEFVPLMLKNGYGRIVNLSSGMGQLADMNGGWPGYRLSKVALNAVTRILADELKEANILVNSACPGWVRTDMGGPEAERSVAEGADTPVWLATLPEGGPTGQFFRDRKSIEW